MCLHSYCIILTLIHKMQCSVNISVSNVYSVKQNMLRQTFCCLPFPSYCDTVEAWSFFFAFTELTLKYSFHHIVVNYLFLTSALAIFMTKLLAVNHLLI